MQPLRSLCKVLDLGVCNLLSRDNAIGELSLVNNIKNYR